MRLRDRLFPNRKDPRPIRRLRIKTYPFVPRPRPFEKSRAGRELTARLEAGRTAYLELCAEIVRDREHLAELPTQGAHARIPHWRNGYLPPLDGMSLYTLVRLLRPQTYLEIGSGNSTKFVRKAIRDHGLKTRIISIDPQPRAEIDDLCDRVVRRPFQDIGEEALDWIGPGDIVFQDGSHHAFTNSDATVFFTEFLPVLPADITYGIHDIFLPGDYPAIWHRRFYNEQYLLLSYLMGGAGGDSIVFPAAFVSQDESLRNALGGIFDLPALAGLQPHGGAFWMRRTK